MNAQYRNVKLTTTKTKGQSSTMETLLKEVVERGLFKEYTNKKKLELFNDASTGPFPLYLYKWNVEELCAAEKEEVNFPCIYYISHIVSC